MKTVGEIVKNTRLSKNISLDDIEKRTKIRKVFLIAIEADDYEKLPSIAIAKGFIKNYAKFLRLDVVRIMAIFRRQLDSKRREKVLPRTVSEPLQRSLWHLTPNKAVGIVVGILFLLLGGYFFQQYRAFQQPPALTIEEPVDGTVVTEQSVAVYGKTDSDATISINDTLITTDETGKFFEEVSLLEEMNTVVIVAKNRNGKETIVKRSVTVTK